MPRPRHGFTLIESLVCLAIASVLLCVAGPAFADLVQRSHAAAARAALLASLMQAVRHAALTGSDVVLCPTGTHAGGADACGATSDWSGGWIAWADLDGDRIRDGGETLVHAEAGLPEGVHLVTSTGRRRLVFQPSGGNAGSNATFTLCDRRGADNAVALVLSNAGRLRAGRPSPAAAQRCVAAGGG
jgi:type IV fimbrial biogenesis protein FimT